MHVWKFIALAFVLLSVQTSSATAQSYSKAFEEISQLNRMDPLQNPGYDRVSEILKRRIFDNKNKVIGEVRDIILKNNGSIASLNVNFNRLHLNNNVFLNYRTMRIRPATHGYVLGYDAQQIKTLYPTLLADIETASGSKDDYYSLNTLIGARIRSQSGRKIGRVEDILFDDSGRSAEALYVALQYKTMRSTKIALPFDSAKIENSFNGKRFIISDVQADAIIDYVKNKRR